MKASVRHVGHLNAVDARLGEFSGSRPPGRTEHHVVEGDPHREVLVAVLRSDRVMDAVILRARKEPPEPAEPNSDIGVDDI
jgi:hypothetical protein